MGSFRRTLAIACAVAIAFVFALPAGASSGDLDPTFGSGGTVASPFGNSRSSTSIALQEDGKIVVHQTGEVLRFDQDGSPDLSFGTDGAAKDGLRGIACGSLNCNGVAIQPNGMIVVSALRYVEDGLDSHYQLQASRLTADGMVDATFNRRGVATVNLDLGEPRCVGGDGGQLMLQPDGKILLAGSDCYAFVTARLLPDGTRDLSFGQKGITKIDVFEAGGEHGMTLTRQSNGAIVVAGTADVKPKVGHIVDQHVVLIRLLPDGRLDPTYGNLGVADFTLPTLVGVTGSTTQSDGKTLVSGYIERPGGAADFMVMRITKQGKRDRSFGRQGVSTTSFGDQDYAFDVDIQSSGRIVAVGFTRFEFRFALAGFRQDGTLDPAFGDGGKILTEFTGDAGAWSLAIQADDRIVAVGWTEDQSTGDESVGLARYEA